MDYRKSPPTAQQCSQADQVYKSSLKNIIEGRCIGCHNPQGNGARVAMFERGQDQKNQDLIKVLKDGQVESLVRTISGLEAHAGGKILNSEEDKQAFYAFFAARKQCGDSVPRLALGGQCRSETLPRRVRLLSTQELTNSLKALLDIDQEISIPGPRTREDFNKNPRLAFSNDAKSRAIDGNLLFQLDAQAKNLATRVTQEQRRKYGCEAEALNENCVKNFLTQAFRRDPTDEELKDYLKLGNFPNLVYAVLLAPDWLYLSELGDDQGILTNDEIASLISYSLTQSPPSPELRRLNLQKAEERKTAVAQLLTQNNAATTALKNFLIDWLEIRSAKNTPKDGAYDGNQEFEAISQAIEQKLKDRKMSLQSLLVDPNTNRHLLSYPAFVAAHSTLNHTSPVKIGKLLARNLLCIKLPSPPANVPTDLGSISKTDSMREKIEAHARNPACQGCHVRLDPFGFAFESFNHLGQPRNNTSDTAVNLKIELSIDGAYNGHQDLVPAIARSPEFSQCFNSFFQQFLLADLSCEDFELKSQDPLFEWIVNLMGQDSFIRRE